MTHRICITVDSEVRERFLAAADREGRSLSEWLREAAEAKWRAQRTSEDQKTVPPGTWQRLLGANHEGPLLWNPEGEPGGDGPHSGDGRDAPIRRGDGPEVRPGDEPEVREGHEPGVREGHEPGVREGDER